jgi:hypothetical protein
MSQTFFFRATKLGLDQETAAKAGTRATAIQCAPLITPHSIIYSWGGLSLKSALFFIHFEPRVCIGGSDFSREGRAGEGKRAKARGGAFVFSPSSLMMVKQEAAGGKPSSGGGSSGSSGGGFGGSSNNTTIIHHSRWPRVLLSLALFACMWAAPHILSENGRAEPIGCVLCPLSTPSLHSLSYIFLSFLSPIASFFSFATQKMNRS